MLWACLFRRATSTFFFVSACIVRGRGGEREREEGEKRERERKMHRFVEKLFGSCHVTRGEPFFSFPSPLVKNLRSTPVGWPGYCGIPLTHALFLTSVSNDVTTKRRSDSEMNKRKRLSTSCTVLPTFVCAIAGSCKHHNNFLIRFHLCCEDSP